MLFVKFALIIALAAGTRGRTSELLQLEQEDGDNVKTLNERGASLADGAENLLTQAQGISISRTPHIGDAVSHSRVTRDAIRHGAGACVGAGACTGPGSGAGDGSCTGAGSCAGANSGAGTGSCTGQNSCSGANSGSGTGACTGGHSCAAAGSGATTGSCTTEGSCGNTASLTLLDASRHGVGACMGAGACTGPGSGGGIGSCGGPRSCSGAGSGGGIGSCSGQYACAGQNSSGGVGSCRGSGACSGVDSGRGVGSCSGTNSCAGRGSGATTGSCSAAGSCAGPGKIMYTAKLVSPIHESACQQALVSSAENFSQTLTDFGNYCLNKNPEVLKHLKVEAVNLNRIVSTLISDVKGGDIGRSRAMQQLVIEDTPLRRLTIGLLDDVKKLSKTSEVPISSRQEYASYAKRLSEALSSLDLTTARCNSSPNVIVF